MTNLKLRCIYITVIQEVLKTKKLLIKNVESTSGGMPGIHLSVNCTDGSSYRIPRDVSRKIFWDATIAILEEDEKIIGMVKVLEFDGNGRPNRWNRLSGKKLVLDGTEEIVDYR